MIIRRVELENIRSHKKSEIELDKGITAFTGRTGSGKSSILMAIEYALFGAESGIQLTSLLRRGASSGKIVVEFEHGGSHYKVVRGLVRTGKSIASDPAELCLYKDGKPIEVFGKSSVLNERIKEILGYPKEVKSKDLFELTSYARQDELRQLIELSPEKRQEQIDRILQLAKYRNAWENMRPIIEHFELKLAEVEGELKGEERIKNELKEMREEVIRLHLKKRELKAELEQVEEVVKEVEEKMKEIKEAYEKALQLRRAFDSASGEKRWLEGELSSLRERKEAMKKKAGEIEGKLKEIAIERIEELESLLNSLREKKAIAWGEINKVEGEVKQLKGLAGKCPLCKQFVSEEYKQALIEELSSLLSKKEVELEKIKGEVEEVERRLKKSKEAEEFLKERESLRKRLSELEEDESKKERRLKVVEEEIKEMAEQVGGIEEIKQKVEEIERRWKEASERRSSLRQALELIEEQVSSMERLLEEKEEELKKVEECKKVAERLSNLVSLLSRLREDIRNIREVVRGKFLQDLRQEFQRRFEEIRKWEEEYAVDVDANYEPFAFTSSGEKVQISNLSGGEKSGVALSFRLALASLAAQIGGIRESELLILDEPTIGFDREDIKALPHALRQLRIPQIIIVSHQPELREAADIEYEIDKVRGASIVKRA